MCLMIFLIHVLDDIPLIYVFVDFPLIYVFVDMFLVHELGCVYVWGCVCVCVCVGGGYKVQPTCQYMLQQWEHIASMSANVSFLPKRLQERKKINIFENNTHLVHLHQQKWFQHLQTMLKGKQEERVGGGGGRQCPSSSAFPTLKCHQPSSTSVCKRVKTQRQTGRRTERQTDRQRKQVSLLRKSMSQY